MLLRSKKLNFARVVLILLVSDNCRGQLDNNLQVVDLTDLDGDLPLNIVSTTQILWQTEDWEHPTWQNPSWPAGGGDTVGFPCVVKNDHGLNSDGKYYLYYSHHDPRSSIGVAVADLITGPYSKSVNVPGRSDNVVVPAFHASSSNPDDPDHTASPWVVWNEAEQLWFVYFHYFNHVRNVVPGFQLTAMATTPDLASHNWTIWESASSGTTPQYVPVLPTTSDSWINEASSYNTVHRLLDGSWLAFLRGSSTTAGVPTKLGFASSSDARNWIYFPENPIIHQNDGGGGRAGVYRPGFIGYLGENGSGVDEYLVAWQESHYFDGDSRLIYGYTTDFKTVTRDPRGHVLFAGSDGAVIAWREGDRLYLFSGKVVHEMVLPLLPPDPEFDFAWGASTGLFFPSPSMGIVPNPGDEVLAQLYLAPNGVIDTTMLPGGSTVGNDVILDSVVVRNDGGAQEQFGVFQKQFQAPFQDGTLYAVMFSSTTASGGDRYYRGPGLLANDAEQLTGLFDMNVGPESANSWNGSVENLPHMRIAWRGGSGFIDDQGNPILPNLGDETLAQLVFSPDGVADSILPGGIPAGDDAIIDARIIRNNGGLWEDYGLFNWVHYEGPFQSGYIYGVAYEGTDPQEGTQFYAGPMQATEVSSSLAQSYYDMNIDFVLGDAFNGSVFAPSNCVELIASFGFVDEQGDPILPGVGSQALIQLIYSPDAVADQILPGGAPADNDTVLFSTTVQNSGGFREEYGFFGPHDVSSAFQAGYIYGVIYENDSPQSGDRYYAGPLQATLLNTPSTPDIYEMNSSLVDGNTWNRTVAQSGAMNITWYGSAGFVDDFANPILPVIGDEAAVQLIYSPDSNRDPILPGGVPGENDAVLATNTVRNNGELYEDYAFFGFYAYSGSRQPGFIYGIIYEDTDPVAGDQYYAGPLQAAPSDSGTALYNLNPVHTNVNAYNDAVLGQIAMLDFDLDGLPNDFESRHFGNATFAEATVDSDFDGLLNLAEYIADTDPTDAASFFGVQSISRNESDIVVILRDSSVNRGYILEFNDGISGSGSWPTADTAATGTGGGLQCIDAGGVTESSRAYRGKAFIP